MIDRTIGAIRIARKAQAPPMPDQGDGVLGPVFLGEKFL